MSPLESSNGPAVPRFMAGPSARRDNEPNPQQENTAHVNAGSPVMKSLKEAPDKVGLLQRLESSEEEQMLLKLLTYDTDGVLLKIPQSPKASWFSTPHHQRVYQAWRALYEAGLPVTPDAMLRTLREQARPEEIELVEVALRRVLEAEVTDAAENLAVALRTAAQCRRFSAMVNQLNSGFHRNDPIEELWGKAAAELAQAEEHESFRGFQEQLNLTLEGILHPDVSTMGLVTKLDQIDMLCGGLEPAQMYVFAGMQGSGKTALYLEIILRLLEFYPDAAVCVLSLEMAQSRLQQRLLSNLSYVSTRRMKDHAKPGQMPLDQNEIDRLVKAKVRMEEWGDRVEMHFRSLGPEGIAEIARKFALKHRGRRKILICDHVGLVESSGRDIRVGIVDAIKMLKRMATEYDYAVIPLAQMVKELESKKLYGSTVHRPDQSFIAESGFINQTADTILCAWRPEVYQAEMEMEVDGIMHHNWETKNRMILVTGKNRDGEMNRQLMLGCNMEFMQIFNLEEEKKYEMKLPITGINPTNKTPF